MWAGEPPAGGPEASHGSQSITGGSRYKVPHWLSLTGASCASAVGEWSWRAWGGTKRWQDDWMFLTFSRVWWISLIGCCLSKQTLLEVCSFVWFFHAWVNYLQTDWMPCLRCCLAVCFCLSAEDNCTNFCVLCSDSLTHCCSIIVIAWCDCVKL